MLTRPSQSRTNAQASDLSLRQGLVTQVQRFYRKSWYSPILLALVLVGTPIPKGLQLSGWSLGTLADQSQSAAPHNVPSDDLGGATKPKKGTPRETTLPLSQPIQQVATHQASLASRSISPGVGSSVRQFCHPLGGLGELTQGNGGLTHQGRMYYAYDLASPIGTPVYAMQSGRVIGLYDRYPDTGGGRERSNKFNYVYLEHDDGYRSVYVHLKQGFRKTISLAVGDWVELGDLIGLSGNSGWSGGPHLHVEVQEPGESPRRFTSTVPFAIASQCDSGYVAQG